MKERHGWEEIGYVYAWHASPSFLQNRGGQKFLKKSGGEDQTILILEVGSVMVGVNFSRGESENFWSK